MSCDTLSVKRFSVSFVALALAVTLPLACSSTQDAAGPDDGQGPGGPNPTVTASVVVSDVSQTAALPGAEAVDGEVSFDGLTVEISEDGSNWLTVTDQPTTATLVLGDGAAQATLVPTTEIPAGDYTRARFTATSAQVDISATVNGQRFAAQLKPPANQPIVIEKDIEVIDNGDGTRTISVELVTVQAFALRVTPGSGISIEIGGDVGSIGGAASMSAAVAAADVSAPAGVDVSGEITFTNLTIELFDDVTQAWLIVAESQGTATISLADGTVDATLVPVDQIPAGTYSRARLTATDVTVDLTAMIGGQGFAAQLKPPTSDPVVIEKDVEAIVNGDGSTTFRFELEMVRTMSLRQGTGGMELVIDGDLGSAVAPVSMAAGVVASDVSAPAGGDVSGEVTFTGLTIELFDDASQIWLIVAENQGSATVALADNTVDATLMPVDQIPAGTYSRARLTATDVTVDLTAMIGGQSFAAQLKPPTSDPVVIEKDVEAIVNGDGSTTFRFELEMVRTMSLRQGTGGMELVIDGDLGSAVAPASMAAGVAASDGSAPISANVSGEVIFTGLTIELFDDASQSWLIVAQDQGSATVALADNTVDATLVPVDQIPAGTYSRARLTAVDALIDVTVDSNGQQVHAQIRPPSSDPIEITKDVEAIVNADGTTTFRFELEMIRTIDVSHDPADGATIVTVEGDLGVSQARAG